MALITGMDSVPHLQIWLLGTFRVRIDSHRVTELDTRLRAAELLKLLALSPAHRLHREEAVELLWPECEPDSAANNLHRTLHTLRRCLEPDLTVGRASAYLHLRGEHLLLWPQDRVWIDAQAFEYAATRALEGGDSADLNVALALYGGDLLPEDRFADWAATSREKLRAAYLRLLVEAARRHVQHHEGVEAIRVIEQVVALEPTHEEAHRMLMRLYAGLGQRHRALRQFHQLRDALERELDTVPEPASMQLNQAIRDGCFAPIQRNPVRTRDVTAAKPDRHLSRREFEIARLVARQMTNRQIAMSLQVSPRTADTHVSRILRKLGMASRRDVAVWLAERGLLV
jgi:DNA-binding SARP family transcriptional activator